MYQFESQQYLQGMLSWARNLQQQIQSNRLNPPGTQAGDQWHSRFNHLVQGIEEAIKRPYGLQSNDIFGSSTIKRMNCIVWLLVCIKIRIQEWYH
jgi:hypothetical protein